MELSLQILTCNISGKAREEVLDGRTFLVAPVVMQKEGVLDGTAGSILYRASLLEASLSEWDGKPLVLNHPKQGDSYISAEAAPESTFGFLKGSKWGDTLVSEAWVDVEKARKIDARIILSLNTGTPINVSTGWMLSLKDTEGTFLGKAYTKEAVAGKPDHLAFLLDTPGACSIKDGCGCFVGNEASYQRISSSLRDAIDLVYGYRYYLRDVYAGFFVYSDGNGDLFLQSYTETDGKVVIGTKDPTPVKWVTEYRTIDGAFVGNCSCSEFKETTPVDKTQMIAVLIGNGSGAWTEADRKTLEGFDEGKLKKLLPVAPANNNPPPPPILNPAAPVTRALTLNEWKAQAPPEVQAVIDRMLADQQAVKAQLVANIKASPRNRFADEFLMNLPVEQLQGMVELASGYVEKPVPNYSGQGILLAPVANQGVSVEPLVEAVIDWSKN